MKLIKSARPRNKGVVLVPFVGSGSECVAAKTLGLDYIGFEINKDYIEIAETAIKNARPESTLIKYMNRVP